MIPFNLEAFRAGQKAISASGTAHISYLATSRSGRIVYEYTDGSVGSTHSSAIRGNYRMISRHQHLIDSYDPEDTWQTRTPNRPWATVTPGVPLWHEQQDYRLHPHNDLIKAYRNGAKIESYIVGEWIEEPTIDWHEDTQYRIKSETKTIYEWLLTRHDGSITLTNTVCTEDTASEVFKDMVSYKKTGRSWEAKA